MFPNINVELDEDDDLTFEDIFEIPDEITLNLNLLHQGLIRSMRPTPIFPKAAISPTAALDKSVKSQYTYSNSLISPFSYYSKEGIVLIIKNKELEKIVYAHSADLNLLNFADRIMCPKQTDPTKFQRVECRAVTDSSKKEALVPILELTTSVNPKLITRKFPMPSYNSQDALGYIDLETNACLFFHADNGKLWSAKKLSKPELQEILTNPDYKNLN